MAATVAPEPAGVVVQGSRKPAATVLSRAEVRELPGALGDPLRAIESLPGVTPTLSGAPYFYVRGAPPGDVGYYFDDVRLPALFHALAGPSVIHPALLERVDFYPGPYPASFGRSAAVVAASSGSGPSPRHGEFSVRATDSSVFLQSPFANDHAELTLAGRYGYANPVLHLFAPDLSVAYWDYQARLRYFVNERSTWSLLAFGAHDLLTQQHEQTRQTLYGVTFHRVDLRYGRELDAGHAEAGVVLGWDRSAVQNGAATVQDLSLKLRGKLERQLDAGTKLYVGGDAGQVRYAVNSSNVNEPETRSDLARRFADRADSLAGVYAGLELSLGRRILLEPGIRTDVYASRSTWALGVDPRVIAEFVITPALSLVNALGIAHEPPTDPLPQPGLEPPLTGGLQTAVQTSAGVRYTHPNGLRIQATLFQNMLLNLTDGPGAARLTDVGAPADARAFGSTRGLELSLKRSLARTWGGYVVYTLSVSRRAFGRVEGPSAFDRTHVFGAAVSHDFGEGYHAGVRVVAYSGIPARVAYLEAARHPPRTPPYYRIDLRAEKRWTLAEGRYLAVVAEVLNATLTREVTGAACNAYTCKQTSTGPVTIPNLGFEGGF